jgi:hypothetical protein
MVRREEAFALQLVLALLAAGQTVAQDNNNNNQATQAAAQPATTAAAANNANNQATAPAAANNQPATTAAAANNANPAQQNTPAAGTFKVTAINLPTTTGAPSSAAASSVLGLTGLPTIQGYGIPTMAVPWTVGAPFMQNSSLPEGTVFICVGALLGIMGAAVLAWRAVIAWSIHRSTARANEKMRMPDQNTKLIKPGYGGAATGGGVTSLAAASTLSLDHLTAASRKSYARSRMSTASPAAARNSSLFFSPTTAGAGGPPNRSSNFLAPGYYQGPGAAAPVAGGASMMAVGGATAGASAAAGRSFGGRQSLYNPSPPGSPALPPSRGGYETRSTPPSSHSMYHQQSMSSLNLNVPGSSHSGGRAPSANLDDMLEGYPPLPTAPGR